MDRECGTTKYRMIHGYRESAGMKETPRNMEAGAIIVEQAHSIFYILQ